MNIIGLGRVGCNIADEFAKYPQYKTFKIDRNLKGKGSFSLPDFEHPEEYEQIDLKMGNFLRGISDRCVFVLSGASIVSGASLRILEKIHSKNVEISILYIEPEVEILGEIKQLQENLVRNVLQQYARSGLFERMYMVKNRNIEMLLGDVTILQYHQALNSYLVSMIHLLNVFENTESVTDTFSLRSDTARICTFGVVAADRSEVMLYPLDQIREMRYYFGIPSEVMNSENSLYREIVDTVKSKISGKVKVSYGIYETSYENALTYGIYYSSRIQEKS